jgi:hypothetical protein
MNTIHICPSVPQDGAPVRRDSGSPDLVVDPESAQNRTLAPRRSGRKPRSRAHAVGEMDEKNAGKR